MNTQVCVMDIDLQAERVEGESSIKSSAAAGWVKYEYIVGAEYIVESIIPHLRAINAMQKMFYFIHWSMDVTIYGSHNDIFLIAVCVSVQGKSVSPMKFTLILLCFAYHVWAKKVSAVDIDSVRRGWSWTLYVINIDKQVLTRWRTGFFYCNR